MLIICLDDLESLMIDLNKIRSVTDFQRNAKEYVGSLKDSKTPLVLTVNGRAELVVQNAASYQELLNRVEELETIAAIRTGLQQARDGNAKPARAALNKLGAKLGL
jgi:PHD/YefM family antitoxin component YafN of YafNO toxin-antitoxin module